jgi:hypothetical protein
MTGTAAHRASSTTNRNITMTPEMQQTGARRSAGRLCPYDSYSVWAQRGADAAGLTLSTGSRMNAAIRWARCLIVLRGCDSSTGKENMTCRGPRAEGVGERCA